MACCSASSADARSARTRNTSCIETWPTCCFFSTSATDSVSRSTTSRDSSACSRSSVARYQLLATLAINDWRANSKSATVARRLSSAALAPARTRPQTSASQLTPTPAPADSCSTASGPAVPERSAPSETVGFSAAPASLAAAVARSTCAESIRRLGFCVSSASATSASSCGSPKVASQPSSTPPASSAGAAHSARTSVVSGRASSSTSSCGGGSCSGVAQPPSSKAQQTSLVVIVRRIGRLCGRRSRL